MDIKRYAELKEAGCITLHEVANRVILVRREWDPATGKEIFPDPMPIDEKSFEEKEKEHQKIVDGIKAFRVDIAAIKKKS